MSKTDNNSFFDIYAHEYDALTDAHKRKTPHEREVKAMIKKFTPSYVLDAGCATGLTAYLFAKNNVSTIGLDCSKPMIKIAKDNYNFENLSFRYGWFEKLPKILNDKFDFIVCLANAISGVGSTKVMIESLKGFHRALQIDGTLVLQMLNFQKIKENEIIPIKLTRKSNIIYQRFMERKMNRLYIYINRIDLNSKPIKHEIFRHEFDNFKPLKVINVLKKVGFKNIKKYNNLFFKAKFDSSSKDLVITAKK
jgi:ubiquinone/menaquinone biosynthesis C-methylase UbiE